MASDGIMWASEHSVDCGVPVELRGFTTSKISGRIEWRVVEARRGRAVIEFPAPGATGGLGWMFSDIGDERE
ncbi:MAG TPA: hypothetical protein VKB79_22390 [Bryobacteraceae bacterium]|nr:hypothetical protein [Bryobacteraceae bacterium]